MPRQKHGSLADQYDPSPDAAKRNAVRVLKPFGRFRIKTVYKAPGVADALETLCSDFEYPNWDWQTVRTFLDVNKPEGGE